MKRTRIYLETLDPSNAAILKQYDYLMKMSVALKSIYDLIVSPRKSQHRHFPQISKEIQVALTSFFSQILKSQNKSQDKKPEDQFSFRFDSRLDIFKRALKSQEKLSRLAKYFNDRIAENDLSLGTLVCSFYKNDDCGSLIDKLKSEESSERMKIYRGAFSPGFTSLKDDFSFTDEDENISMAVERQRFKIDWILYQKNCESIFDPDIKAQIRNRISFLRSMFTAGSKIAKLAHIIQSGVKEFPPFIALTIKASTLKFSYLKNPIHNFCFPLGKVINLTQKVDPGSQEALVIGKLDSQSALVPLAKDEMISLSHNNEQTIYLSAVQDDLSRLNFSYDNNDKDSIKIASFQYQSRKQNIILV